MYLSGLLSKNKTEIDTINFKYNEEFINANGLIDNNNLDWKVNILLENNILFNKMVLDGNVLVSGKWIKNKINTPSLTGRFMYFISNKMYVQWPALLNVLPKAIFLGNLLE